MKKLIFLMIFSLSIAVYGEAAYIGSFNTLHLGWSRDKDYEGMAEFLEFFDLVALQEVMDEDGLKELLRALEDQGEERWGYLISERSTGRGEYREHYAYIWRDDRVQLVEDLGYYEGEMHHKFERPPYGATFRIENFDLTLVNIHLIFGKSINDRRAEALNIDSVYNYFQRINGPEQDILLAGDFNLPAYDEAFISLLSHDDSLYYGIDPVNKTTIGKEGLANSYDNIFYSYKFTREYTGNSGIIDYTNGRYRVVRRSISDHLPVFIQVETGRDDD